MYKCISDEWENMGEHYDTVAEFLDMCEAVFDQAPILTTYDGGLSYFDKNHREILVAMGEAIEP